MIEFWEAVEQTVEETERLRGSQIEACNAELDRHRGAMELDSDEDDPKLKVGQT